MRRWWLVLFFCAGLPGCEADVTEGNGVATEETRTVAAFEEAVVEDGVGLELSASGVAGDVTLSVSGDENLLPLVETVVETSAGRRRLTVRSKEAFSTGLGLVVRGAAPDLLAIGGDTGGTAVVTGVDVANVFESAVANGGRVAVSGTAGRFDAIASGGGVIAARGLTATEARIGATGGATVEVCATDTLSAEAKDGAVITYACGPDRITPVTSGGGVVQPAE